MGRIISPGREAGAYRSALERLARSSAQGMRLGLESTRELCSRLGDPQIGLRGVLVAGTNGKGSVCALVAEPARRSGMRVALLTKPHLTSYRERISLGGEPISVEEFAADAEEVANAADKMEASGLRPTHHEILTAMGFLAARRWAAELVVCEVGLGGRLDATNVWNGGVSALVSVGLDHQAQLGNTIEKIAAEKAAIVKQGNLVVSGLAEAARGPLREAVRRTDARLWQLGEEIHLEPSPEEGEFSVRTPAGLHPGLRLRLQGEVQRSNAALAAAICDCLRDLGLDIPERDLREGFAEVSWPGRMQLLSSGPEVLVDAAHNPAAVETILPELRRLIEARPSVLLFGSMTDHDHRGMLALLSSLEFKAAVITRAETPRAAEPEDVARDWPGRPLTIDRSVGSALERARVEAGPAGLVVVLGSIYVVGEVMAALGEGLPPDPEVPQPPMW